MKVLRSRLYEAELQKQNDAIAKERKGQVGTGDRSEKIRTYNFPQSRVTDHRINFTTHQLQSVLDGNLDELIGALTTYYTAEKLREVTEHRSEHPREDQRRPGPAGRPPALKTARPAATPTCWRATCSAGIAPRSTRARPTTPTPDFIERLRRADRAPRPPRAGRLHPRRPGILEPRFRCQSGGPDPAARNRADHRGVARVPAADAAAPPLPRRRHRHRQRLPRRHRRRRAAADVEVIATDISRAGARRRARERRAPRRRRIGSRSASRAYLIGARRAPFDFILSNPPYVTESRIPEPRARSARVRAGARRWWPARTASATSARSSTSAPRQLAPGGTVLIEIGYEQADAVADLVMSFRRCSLTTISNDLQSIPRVAVIERKNRPIYR